MQQKETELVRQDQPKGTPAAKRLLEIRAIALGALSGLPLGLKHWDYLGELKQLKIHSHKVDWLEARVALFVALRERPSQAVGGMNTLRALCAETGQTARFEAFEALINVSLGDGRLSNHSYGAANFADMGHAQIWARVSDHLSWLSQNGHMAFLNSGTLLGVVRDRKLIDHDDDIDLAVILKAGNVEEAAGAWRQLGRDLAAQGVIDTGAERVLGLYKLLRVDDIQIDLFPAWFEGERFFVYPYSFGALSRADVLPLQPCPVTGHPIPAAPEKMLALNYGEGWHSPDPYFKFPWPKAHRNFKDFLSQITK